MRRENAQSHILYIIKFKKIMFNHGWQSYLIKIYYIFAYIFSLYMICIE